MLISFFMCTDMFFPGLRLYSQKTKRGSDLYNTGKIHYRKYLALSERYRWISVKIMQTTLTPQHFVFLDYIHICVIVFCFKHTQSNGLVYYNISLNSISRIRKHLSTAQISSLVCVYKWSIVGTRPYSFVHTLTNAALRL